MSCFGSIIIRHGTNKRLKSALLQIELTPMDRLGDMFRELDALSEVKQLLNALDILR
jgi:hypothetical protein